MYGVDIDPISFELESPSLPDINPDWIPSLTGYKSKLPPSVKPILTCDWKIHSSRTLLK